VSTAGWLSISLLLGPIGGFVLLIANYGLDGVMAQATRPPSWTAPPLKAETLHAEILQGRRPQANALIPRPFVEVFASGTLGRQQEAIAAISLNYRPQLLPALRLALASEMPALRVQAAAVYAKLRGSFGERAKALRAAAMAAPLSADLAAEAEAVAASGFVDAETAAELMAHAARATTIFAGTPGPKQNALTQPPRMKRHACGGVI
jgi:hypothetical protein